MIFSTKIEETFTSWSSFSKGSPVEYIYTGDYYLPATDRKLSTVRVLFTNTNLEQACLK